MKNQIRLLTLIVLTFFSLSAFAQTFGIKGGLNMSNLKETGDGSTSTYDNKFGFHVGITSEFGKSFSFAPEVLLSTKGTKWDESSTLYAGQINLLQIDIPLYAKYTYDMGAAKIFGLFGPYIGILLKANIEGDDFEGRDFLIGNDPENDDFKRTDIGLSFGGGLQFNKITVGLSYNFSILNTTPVESDDDYVSKNTVIAVSVGYKFK